MKLEREDTVDGVTALPVVDEETSLLELLEAVVDPVVRMIELLLNPVPEELLGLVAGTLDVEFVYGAHPYPPYPPYTHTDDVVVPMTPVDRPVPETEVLVIVGKTGVELLLMLLVVDSEMMVVDVMVTTGMLMEDTIDDTEELVTEELGLVTVAETSVEEEEVDSVVFERVEVEV